MRAVHRARSSRGCCIPTRRGALTLKRLSKVRPRNAKRACSCALNTPLTPPPSAHAACSGARGVSRAQRGTGAAARSRDAWHARKTHLTCLAAPPSRRRSLPPPGGSRSARTARGSSRRRRRAPQPYRTRPCRRARAQPAFRGDDASTPPDSRHSQPAAAGGQEPVGRCARRAGEHGNGLGAGSRCAISSSGAAFAATSRARLGLRLRRRGRRCGAASRCACWQQVGSCRAACCAMPRVASGRGARAGARAARCGAATARAGAAARLGAACGDALHRSASAAAAGRWGRGGDGQGRRWRPSDVRQ